jgi:hypothetical protein
MTKKDYELIARSLYSSIEDLKSWDDLYNVRRDDFDQIIEHIVGNLALALDTTNPRFDIEKFEAACGIKIKK